MTTASGVKSRTLFFYFNTDSAKAVELTLAERAAGREAVPRDASTQFIDREAADVIVIMPEVPPHHRNRVREVYGDKQIIDLDPRNVSVQQPDGKVLDVKTVVESVTVPKAQAYLDYSGDLSALTNKALRVLAIQRQVDISKYRTRDEMIAALKEKQAQEEAPAI